MESKIAFNEQRNIILQNYELKRQNIKEQKQASKIQKEK
jgi:hypothetical protein